MDPPLPTVGSQKYDHAQMQHHQPRQPQSLTIPRRRVWVLSEDFLKWTYVFPFRGSVCLVLQSVCYTHSQPPALKHEDTNSGTFDRLCHIKYGNKEKDIDKQTCEFEKQRSYEK